MTEAVSLKRVVFHDGWLKLLALALAISTWFYIDAELQELAHDSPRRPAAADHLLPPVQE